MVIVCMLFLNLDNCCPNNFLMLPFILGNFIVTDIPRADFAPLKNPPSLQPLLIISIILSESFNQRKTRRSSTVYNRQSTD